MRFRAGMGRLKVSLGRALRDLAGREQQDRGDQVGTRLRPGTEWFGLIPSGGNLFSEPGKQSGGISRLQVMCVDGYGWLIEWDVS